MTTKTRSSGWGLARAAKVLGLVVAGWWLYSTTEDINRLKSNVSAASADADNARRMAKDAQDRLERVEAHLSR